MCFWFGFLFTLCLVHSTSPPWSATQGMIPDEFLEKFGAHAEDLDGLPLGVAQVGTHSLQISFDLSALGLESLESGFVVALYTNGSQPRDRQEGSVTGYFQIPGLEDGIHGFTVAVEEHRSRELVAATHVHVDWRVSAANLNSRGGGVWDPLLRRPHWALLPRHGLDRIKVMQRDDDDDDGDDAQVEDTAVMDVEILHPQEGQILFDLSQFVVVVASSSGLEFKSHALMLTINDRFAMHTGPLQAHHPLSFLLPPKLKNGVYKIGVSIHKAEELERSIHAKPLAQHSSNVRIQLKTEGLSHDNEDDMSSIYRPWPFEIKSTMNTRLDSKLAVVWAMHASAWEFDWFEELLESIPHTSIVDATWPNVLAETVIVVISENEERNRPAHLLISYLLRLRSQGSRVGVIHLSDEIYSADIFWYPWVDFVVRNYYMPRIAEAFPKQVANRIVTVPLGYKSGFMQALPNGARSKPAKERKYKWNFLGQVSGKIGRRAMLMNANSIPGGVTFETASWNDAKALSTGEYANVLADSQFTLCPLGNSNPDSFRIVESLEAGSIPVVPQNDYYEKLFGDDHPFATVKSDWSDLAAVLSLEDVNAKQQSCTEWWARQKTLIKQRVRQLILSASQTQGNK